MRFADDDITRIVEDIWSSMLGLPVRPVASARVEGPSVSACVTIAGGWSGAVLVQAPRPLAEQVAAAMFAVDVEDVDDELVHDALGELANIAGGNVKSLGPGPSSLSLPTVSGGDGHSVSVPGSEVVNRVAFDSAGHPFTVTVLART